MSAAFRRCLQASSVADDNNLLLHRLDMAANIGSAALLVRLFENGMQCFVGTGWIGEAWGTGLGGRLGR